MLKKVIRVGNSLGVILPARYTRRLKITEHSILEISIIENQIIIEVVKPEETNPGMKEKPTT